MRMEETEGANCGNEHDIDVSEINVDERVS